VEESLAPLLPVKVRVKEGNRGPLVLRREGRPLAFLEIESENLSPDEISRWSYAILALAQEIFDRLWREKTFQGYPGAGLLSKQLERQPLSGLLIKFFSDYQPEGAFCLEDQTFFLPEAGKDFLLDLWQKGEIFTSASVHLESPEEIEEASSLLELAELLGFSWLSAKAVRYLSELGFSEENLSVLKTLQSLNRKGYVLVLAEGPAPSLRCLETQAEKTLHLDPDKALLALSLSAKETASLLKDLHLRSGFIEGHHRHWPLVKVWAAFEHARRLAEERPVLFEPYSLHALADIYFDLGDLAAAQKAYFLAAEGTAQPLDLLNSLGLVMIHLNQRKAARFLLAKAVQEDPKDPLLHYNLALFLEKEGKDEEALEHFYKAHDLARSQPLYAEALAQRLALKKEWEKIKEILRGSNLGAEGLYLLGKAYYESGQLEEALRFFKKTIEIAPKHQLALAHLALLFIQLKGEYSLAEAILPEIENEEEGELAELAQDLTVLLEREK